MMRSKILNGANYAALAPTSVSGCISEISSNDIHCSEHDYNAAMKSYGTIYENYQAYLMPTLLPHDYDLVAKLAPDVGHIGCLNADVFEAMVSQDDISDDDIEDCGYTAWVHH